MWWFPGTITHTLFISLDHVPIDLLEVHFCSPRTLNGRFNNLLNELRAKIPAQQDLVLKLHHLLEQEADELKRLLGAKAGTVGKLTSDPMATRATLARLKTDVASRRMHEAGVSTSEVPAFIRRRHSSCALDEQIHKYMHRWLSRRKLEGPRETIT